MSKFEKLIARLLSKPKDFTWGELVSLLGKLGYREMAGGGSRRKFISERNEIISMHKPHPAKILKTYAVNEVIEHLKEKGKI